MKVRFLIILAILPFIVYSQTYKRNIFEYEKLKIDTISNCNKEVLENLEKSFVALQENNSNYAVKIAKQEYEKIKNCPQVFEVYGYSLFRSGEWFDGIEILEKGIEKFGSNPNLIKRKSEMSIEMAELGTGQKNIDGNSVYKANSLKYDEEQFKSENFRSALNDLEYLVKVYNRNEEIFYIAKINQILKNFEKSNELFNKLLNDENYKNPAIFNISENFISLNRFEDAENELNKLLIENPKAGQIYEKFAEIYELKKDKTKSLEFKNKGIFFNNIPEFSNLDYTTENFELLQFFEKNENNPDKKIKKLKEIEKQNNQEYIIDVCLMILKLHANHGNGVEEKATEILEKIGKPSIEKVNLLFQTDVSTCTITNLSDIMATVKDENSWELLKKYLPQIANMPMTLIPPSVPEKMIKFDEDKGITEILLVVKNLLINDTKNDDPMAGMSNFSQYVFYSPLKKVSKSKLKKIASELYYTDEEFKKLEDKIK
jgi:tetratricopeptide (TPR) repeat protein